MIIWKLQDNTIISGEAIVDALGQLNGWTPFVPKKYSLYTTWKVWQPSGLDVEANAVVGNRVSVQFLELVLLIW